MSVVGAAVVVVGAAVVVVGAWEAAVVEATEGSVTSAVGALVTSTVTTAFVSRALQPTAAISTIETEAAPALPASSWNDPSQTPAPRTSPLFRLPCEPLSTPTSIADRPKLQSIRERAQCYAFSEYVVASLVKRIEHGPSYPHQDSPPARRHPRSRQHQTLPARGVEVRPRPPSSSQAPCHDPPHSRHPNSRRGIPAVEGRGSAVQVEGRHPGADEGVQCVLIATSVRPAARLRRARAGAGRGRRYPAASIPPG